MSVVTRRVVFEPLAEEASRRRSTRYTYERLGFWKLVSRIFPENVASLALHEKAGFRVVGVYRYHARLDGEWRDCVIVEKLLGDSTRANPVTIHHREREGLTTFRRWRTLFGADRRSR